MHGVPVRTARRQRQRAARRDAEQPLLRVEDVEEREEVVLVGAAPVEQDEQALPGRPRRRRRCSVSVNAARARTSGSGVSTGSSSSRRCSNAGGSESRSPSDSSGSSVAKPGPIVASSKRMPFGSRK